MAKRKQTRQDNHIAPAVIAGVLAWVLPGAGHLFLRKPIRAIILFVVIHGLFWGGVAICGVFTVNPRDQLWWSRAQLLTGASGVYSYYRQDAKHKKVLGDLAPEFAKLGKLPPNAPADKVKRDKQHRDEILDRKLQADNLAVVYPESDVALVLSGVAGMLNLMCVLDAVLLGLLGQFGERRHVKGQPEGTQ